MKRIRLIVFLFQLCLGMFAQDIEVKKFESLDVTEWTRL